MFHNTYLKIFAFLSAFVFLVYVICQYKKYGIERLESLRKKTTIIAAFVTFIAFATVDDSGKSAPLYTIILFPLAIGAFYFFGKESYNNVKEWTNFHISYPAYQLCFLLLLALWTFSMLGVIAQLFIE